MTPSPQSSNRAFGLVFAALFLFIAFFPLLFSGGDILAWSLVISSLFFLIALIYPDILGLLNSIWLKFGEHLQKFTNPIFLGIIFYLVITPYGIVMRLFMKDPLSRKTDPNLKSYWNPRNSSNLDSDFFKNQF